MVGHQLAVHHLGRLGRVHVLDEVADPGLPVFADRRVETDRLAGDPQQLFDLRRGLPELLGQLVGGGFLLVVGVLLVTGVWESINRWIQSNWLAGFEVAF